MSPLDVSYWWKRVNCICFADTSIDTKMDRTSYVLINSLSVAWTNNAAFRGLFNDQWGPPVEAEMNGLSSTFKEKFPEDQKALKPGQKVNDQRTWEEVGLSCLIQFPIPNSYMIRVLTLQFSLSGTRSSLKPARDIVLCVRTTCAVLRRQSKNIIPRTLLNSDES